MAIELNQVIDHSLTLYLREEAFPTRQWVINVSSEELQPYANTIDNQVEVGKFQAAFDNWIYYSSGVSGVTVPAVISPSTNIEYIDYENGIVSYTGVLPTSVTATYSYGVVNVIDGFPDWEVLADTRLPVVAVQFETLTRAPFALGGGHFMDRVFNIDIFANSDSERDQVTQVIQDALKYQFPILTLETEAQQPLDFNGSRNVNYVRDTQVQRYARVTDLDVRNIRVPDQIQKFSHRALVTVRVQITE